MCYEVDHCSRCGRYTVPNNTIVRQGKDGQPETVCIECISSEQAITEQAELVCVE